LLATETYPSLLVCKCNRVTASAATVDQWRNLKRAAGFSSSVDQSLVRFEGDAKIDGGGEQKR
jgi:hypothetical protein